MSKANAASKGGWILVEWDGQTLTAHAPYDLEKLEQLRKGVPLRAQFAQPRSMPRHRLYWVVLRLVVNNTNMFQTEEALHKTLLVGCGIVEPVVTVDGEIIMIPSSTAFDAMTEETFKAYFDEAMLTIENHIIPGVDLTLLLKEARKQANWREKDEKEAA
jgi:hypothetical protein